MRILLVNMQFLHQSIHEDKTINAGEVPDPGPPDGATPEGSSEGDDHNGEESDEEGKVLDHAYAPD